MSSPHPSRALAGRPARGRGNLRRAQSFVLWALAWAVTAGALLLVVDILASVVIRGLPGLRMSVFLTQTSGIAGGLQNAVLGTLDLIFWSVLFGTPVGVLAGIYIALFASPGTARVLRFTAEVMAGVPSIVIGYFGYTIMVQAWGFGFSVLAGAISLTILTLPYIVRTTEASLRQVPKSFYEGALALGLSPGAALRSVLLPSALPGILTGLLLAVSIGLGETAPLLYTAGWSNYNPSMHLIKNPVGYLTYVVWTYLNEPYSAAHQLAYTAALLLVLLVLALHVGVRLLERAARTSSSANSL